MLSNSLEGLACELHIDIDRRLLAGADAEARGGTDLAMRVYAQPFLTRRRLLELVADPSCAERPQPPARPPPRSPGLRPTSHHGPTGAPSGRVAGPTLAGL